MDILGIDIGGSGIKAAPVDVSSGTLLDERLRIDTPSPATPEATVHAVRRLIDSFQWHGPIGIGFPSLFRGTTIASAANLDDSWLGRDGVQVFGEATDCPLAILNDADAAGLGEVRFGAARNLSGTLLVVTVGTGIGTALFHDGHLFPNTEFGHIEIDGMAAEKRISAAVRKAERLSWETWSARFNEYLKRIERLFAPDTIVLGGGISRKFPKFAPFLETTAAVLPAQLHNNAGIIGAAFACSRTLASPDAPHSSGIRG